MKLLNDFYTQQPIIDTEKITTRAKVSYEFSHEGKHYRKPLPGEPSFRINPQEIQVFTESFHTYCHQVNQEIYDNFIFARNNCLTVSFSFYEPNGQQNRPSRFIEEVQAKIQTCDLDLNFPPTLCLVLMPIVSTQTNGSLKLTRWRIS